MKFAQAVKPIIGIKREGNYKEELIFNSTSELKAALLENYVKEIAPPRFDSERGVKISVQLSLSQLSDVNVVRQEVEFYSWWRHKWRDPRLQWDPKDWGRSFRNKFRRSW